MAALDRLRARLLLSGASPESTQALARQAAGGPAPVTQSPWGEFFAAAVRNDWHPDVYSSITKAADWLIGKPGARMVVAVDTVDDRLGVNDLRTPTQSHLIEIRCVLDPDGVERRYVIDPDDYPDAETAAAADGVELGAYLETHPPKPGEPWITAMRYFPDGRAELPLADGHSPALLRGPLHPPAGGTPDSHTPEEVDPPSPPEP